MHGSTFLAEIRAFWFGYFYRIKHDITRAEECYNVHEMVFLLHAAMADLRVMRQVESEKVYQIAQSLTSNAGTALQDYENARATWLPYNSTSPHLVPGISKWQHPNGPKQDSHGHYLKFAREFSDCGVFVGYCFSGYGANVGHSFPPRHTQEIGPYLQRVSQQDIHLFDDVTTNSAKARMYSPKRGDVWIFVNPDSDLPGHTLLVMDGAQYAQASLGSEAPNVKDLKFIHHNGSTYYHTKGQAQPYKNYRPVDVTPPLKFSLTRPSQGFAVLSFMDSEKSMIVTSDAQIEVPASSVLRTAQRQNAYYLLSADNTLVRKVSSDMKSDPVLDVSTFRDKLGEIAGFDVSQDGSTFYFLSLKDFLVYKCQPNLNGPLQHQFSRKQFAPLFSKKQFELLGGRRFDPSDWPSSPNILLSPGGDRIAFTVPSDEVIAEGSQERGAVTYVCSASNPVFFKNVGRGFPVTWLDKGTLTVQDDVNGQTRNVDVESFGERLLQNITAKLHEHLLRLKGDLKSNVQWRLAPAINLLPKLN